MKHFDLALRPIRYASVSGGKDSLYMLGLILSNLDKYPLDLVVHFQLEIDYPWTQSVVNYMEIQCIEHGIKFLRIRPRKTWNELYEKYGFPSRKVRWCNGKYKLDAKEQLNQWIKSQFCRPVAYIGFCADEVKRFKYEIGNIIEGQEFIYPLAEEGIEENTVLEWARNQPIFNDFYKVNYRQGCMYCPMLQYREMAYQMIKYPELSSIYWRMVFKEWNERKINCLRGDKYTPDYIYKRVKDYWVPKVLEELKKHEQ